MNANKEKGSRLVKLVDGKIILERPMEFLKCYSPCGRYEYDIIELKYGFFIINLSYDPSPPGKDNHWRYIKAFCHVDFGRIDLNVFGDKDDTFDWDALHVLNFNLISYRNVFYNQLLQKQFELPSWITSYSDFNTETGLADLKIVHNVLIKIVNGRVYYILLVDGIEHWLTSIELNHSTPLLYENGVDEYGDKLVVGNAELYPTVLNQYLLYKDFCYSIVDKNGMEIIGGILSHIIAYNDFFYVFMGKWNNYLVYDLYGNLLFDSSSFNPLGENNRTCYRYEIRLQENQTFIVEYKNLFYLFDDRGKCLNNIGYCCLRDFSCGMAFFIKEDKRGYVKYTKARGLEEFIVNSNMVQDSCKLDFKDGYIDIDGIIYNVNFEKVEEYPLPGLEMRYKRLSEVASESCLYYNGEKIDIGLKDVFVKKDLGNGFFLGSYIQKGQFDVNGNIVFLEKEDKFPIVYEQNAPKKNYYYTRQILTDKLKYRRMP